MWPKQKPSYTKIWGLWGASLRKSWSGGEWHEQALPPPKPRRLLLPPHPTNGFIGLSLSTLSWQGVPCEAYSCPPTSILPANGLYRA